MARRASAAPRLLPIPRPIRNTARINENVYTVPPSRSDSKRVQTTSAPSAAMPEKAIARYTAQLPARRAAPGFLAAVAGASYRPGAAAKAKAIAATVTLMPTAT